MRILRLQFVAIICMFISCKTTLKTVTLQNQEPDSAPDSIENGIPIDQNIIKGVLPNGLTYYLYSTDVVEDRASYYIIQNVGSIVETDTELGFAHFLEHLAFNGTETYPGKTFLNKMQDNGLVFGRDINAYTGYDETVYNVNNIPTNELTEDGLQILHDWANALLLTDEEIDAERGVVKEEWRSRQDGRGRIFDQVQSTVFGGSKYGERSPIGDMDIIENFKYDELRNFYHNWYRTDLQAIAIIGDFDVEEMESRVREKFSTIPTAKNPIERVQVSIADNDELDYKMAMDKEVATSNISFSIRHKKPQTIDDVTDLKNNLYHNIITTTLNQRFRELGETPDSDFLRIQVSFRGFTRLYSSFSLDIYPKPNKQAEAFSTAMTELNRAVKFGFSNAELDRAIANYVSFYENSLERWNDRPHRAILNSIRENYLNAEPLTDPNAEFDVAKGILGEMTSDKLREELRRLYTHENRSVIVTGVEGNDNLEKEEAIEIINRIENDDSLQPYQDTELGESIMEGVTLLPGKIIDETVNNELGYTAYTLSNGVQVYHKFVDKQKNNVSLNAVSEGGLSLLSEDDYFNANLMRSIIQMSGINSFSRSEMQKLMAGKQASLGIRISELEESISGRSSTNDVEALLQLFHLTFTNPRFDTEAIDIIKQNLDNQRIAKSQNLRGIMSDSLNVAMHGTNDPLNQLLTKELIETLNIEKIKSIYMDRFGNAADFKIFIAGDISKELLKPMLEKYIASIPTSSEKESWKPLRDEWISDKIDKDIFLAMDDPKCSVNVILKKTLPFTLENEYLIEIMGKLLQIRYLETIREEEGGAYTARAYSRLIEDPISEATLSISFECNPNMVDNLVGIVYTEIEKIKKGDIMDEDLDKVLKSILKDREEAKNNNGYYLESMMTYEHDKYNMDDPKNFEEIIHAITENKLQAIANEFLEKSDSCEIIFKPKK